MIDIHRTDFAILAQEVETLQEQNRNLQIRYEATVALRAALLSFATLRVATPEYFGPCWCDRIGPAHFDHDARCLAARDALEATA